MRVRHWRGLVPIVVAIVMLGAALVAVPPAAPPAAAAPAQSVTDYDNPVRTGAIVNPFVVKSGSTYYAYINGFNFPASTPWYGMIMQSSDLRSWTNVRAAMANPGAWADASSGLQVTSLSVLNVPSNAPNQQWVMYYTGVKAGTQTKCIGLATAATAAGPFAPAADPFVCPTAGAQDPSPMNPVGAFGVQQLLYRSGNAIYNQVLEGSGLAFHPSHQPRQLYAAKPGWWQGGVAERPAGILVGNQYYLFFSGGAANTDRRAVGWTPCQTQVVIMNKCDNQTQLGTWLAGSGSTPDEPGSVAAPSGVQVFSDGARSWIVYDARPGGACNASSCNQNAGMYVDKLCFGHGQPRTNAPTTTAQPLARDAVCSVDVPGADLDVNLSTDVVDDGTVVGDDQGALDLDGNISTAASGRSLWVFGDDGRGGTYRTNSASYGVPHAGATGPQWVSTAAPPTEMIKRTPAEVAFDTANNVPCTPAPGQTCERRRIILWSNGAVGLPDGGAVVIFGKAINIDTYSNVGGTITRSGWNGYLSIGTGAITLTAAQVAAGATAGPDRTLSATPIGCAGSATTAEGCLFDGSADPDPSIDSFRTPLLDGGYLYLYSGRLEIQPPWTVVQDRAKAVRAPVADISNPAAWRYWAGPTAGWTGTSYAQAVELPGMLGQNGGHSITYNSYLDKYLHVRWLLGAMQAQTATDPAGPWSAPETILNLSSCPGGSFPRTPSPHQELSTRGQRSLPFTYFRPASPPPDSEQCPAELRWATVNLG